MLCNKIIWFAVSKTIMFFIVPESIWTGARDNDIETEDIWKLNWFFSLNIGDFAIAFLSLYFLD